MIRQLGPITDGRTPQQVEAEILNTIQEFCEQNGKPCCINLITDADIKFLKSLTEHLSTDNTHVEEQSEDAGMDEIDFMIRKEEQELLRV